ncbi:MAG: tRNA-(ms[2]io[6]A)-hydroxylase [Halieaceae bacterium]|jgi:tRNA 2-(methylsulfanyl)-N6-isopentenyladenosine37 hydroxylase|nr:tRNA-(ms[2]io[6]A)-hydroxylase [Halieaceae bacterium]
MPSPPTKGPLQDVDLSEIKAFLLCETPRAWVDWALSNVSILLLDHANCEMKAAQSAQSVIWKYGMGSAAALPDGTGSATSKARIHRYTMLNKLSRLAREELRHFEQVIAIMKKRRIDYQPLSASGYAGELHRQKRTHEPARLVDTLLIGAIIEARSCERFARLVPVVDESLSQFFGSLLKSEARHFQDYLQLASAYSSEQEVVQRLPQLLAIESQMIEGTAEEFRFHSGVPKAAY